MSKRAEEVQASAILPESIISYAKEHAVLSGLVYREGVKYGYEQAEKDMIDRIRKQVKQWMPEKDGEEHTYGERMAFNSVLHLLEEMEEE